MHPIRLALLLMLLLTSCQSGNQGPDDGADEQRERLEDVQIEFFLATDSSAAGLTERPVRSEGRVVFLSATPVLDTRQIESAQIAESEFGNGIRLILTDEGRTLLHEVTAANVGRIMAIVIDGEVISAPIIRDAMDTSQVLVTGSLTDEEMEWIVAALNARGTAPR